MLAPAILAGALAVIAAAAPQRTAGPPEEPALSGGRELYVSFCAACHGAGGRGDGPAAKATKKKALDLSALRRNNGGVFPEKLVKAAIRNEEGPIAHGTAAMPVWGPVFQKLSEDRRDALSKLAILRESSTTEGVLAEIRVEKLTRYVESLQAE
jgi:mono/diheme cytochrome c family protein